MSKSLADLRANPAVRRSERSVPVCLRPDLVAEVQRVTDLLADAEDRAAQAPQRPRKAAEREAVPEDVAELRGRLEGLLEEMAEHEGTLTLRANLDDGEWRRWADANPPRPEGEPGHERDQRVGFGIVNADALVDDLALFVHAWNDEPLSGGDWADFLAPSVPAGDKAQAVREVVAMYESRLDFQQWRSGLSATLRSATASVSPETSR